MSENASLNGRELMEVLKGETTLGIAHILKFIITEIMNTSVPTTR